MSKTARAAAAAADAAPPPRRPAGGRTRRPPAPLLSPAGEAEAARDRGDKSRRILAAAAHVFAGKGFFNARVADIARAAHVADGTIYLYFKNKDDILIRLFEEAISEIMVRLRAAVAAAPDPIAQFRAYLQCHFEAALENREIMQVITVELRQSTKFMKEYRNEKFQEYLGILGGIVERGIRDGAIRADLDPSLFRRAVFGMIDELNLYFSLSKRFGIEHAAYVAGQIADAFVEGIRARGP